MATRASLPLVLIVSATSLLACTETLRLPPPASGAAGAPTSDSHEYAPTAPAATGGGLVSGGGGGATGVSSGGGGPGLAPSGGGAVGGGAVGGTGTAGTVGTGPMATPPPSLPSAPWVLEGRGKYTDLKNPPIGMSRDGARVLEKDGALWIADGDSPGSVVATLGGPSALSTDGTTVVGLPAPATCGTPLLWRAGGMEMLGLPGSVGSVTFVSGDGTVAAGTAPFGACSSDVTGAFMWQTGKFLPVPTPSGQRDTSAAALSEDGSTMIVLAWAPPEDSDLLFSFSRSRGLTMLIPVGRPTFSVFVSVDGATGAGTIVQTGNAVAFYWTGWGSGGLQLLPKPANRGQTIAFGLSADGQVVLALGNNAPASPPTLATQDGLPFVWSASSGADTLAVPAGVMGFETALMTPDASLIVGNPTPNLGMPVVVWNRQRVPGFLFADAPMFLQRCHPVVTNVSADGKTFAGSCDANARRTGFVARFP